MTDYESQLVSIITPSYQAEEFISDTIRSVQAQSYQNWELIIVDDCSTDASFDIASKLATLDNRIRPIRHARNLGPACARNTGLSNAKGRWIAFLDADDIWLKDKLEKQLSFHKDANAIISFTEFRRISEDGSIVGRRIEVPDSLNYFQLLANTAIATSTVVVDLANSGAFAMKKTYYDDYACWLDLLRQGGTARGLHEDLMRYRVRGGSVSRNKFRSAHAVWKVYREIEGINLLWSLWYFLQYGIHGSLKYRKF